MFLLSVRSCKETWQYTAAVNRQALNHFAAAGDVKPALSLLNEELQKEEDPAARYQEWRQTVADKRKEFPMWYPKRDDVIVPQWAIKACPTPLRLMSPLTTA